MRVDAHVPCRPSGRLILPVGNVLLGRRAPILFGQAWVDQIDRIVPPSNQEVIRLHVAIYQILLVEMLYS